MPNTTSWYEISRSEGFEPFMVRRSQHGELEFKGQERAGTYPFPAALGIDQFGPYQYLTYIHLAEGLHRAAVMIEIKQGEIKVDVEDLGLVVYDSAGQEVWLRDIGGQGGRVNECVICGADEYEGALQHKPGCDELRARVEALRAS